MFKIPFPLFDVLSGPEGVKIITIVGEARTAGDILKLPEARPVSLFFKNNLELVFCEDFLKNEQLAILKVTFTNEIAHFLAFQVIALF